MTLGIITGLAAEARLARPLGHAEPGGGQRPGAEAAAERLVAAGATALLSFGLAGGLDPRLPAGALVIPEAVLDRSERFPTDPILTAWLGGPNARLLLQGDAILASPAAKAAAFAATSAAAVDLESGAVARIAARHGLPFAVLRAVSDPATRALPAAALVALGPDGAIAPWRVARALLARPQDLPALLALGRDAARAQRQLRAHISQIGPFGRG